MATSAAVHGRRGSGEVRWFAGSALLSLVTMPVTAIWSWAAGGALLLGSTAVQVAARRSPMRWSTGQLVGLGLLVGPAVYLSLALLQ